MIQRRYYFHGDVNELNINKYFCALCDSFEYKEHFYSDDNHKANNQGKYVDSLNRYKKANKNFYKNFLRPAKTENLFSSISYKINGNFYSWLTKQRDRDDPVGNLARDVMSDKSFPKETDSFSIIKIHLVIKNASDEVIQTLREAFDEFNTK